jgi:hypothetical protein
LNNIPNNPGEEHGAKMGIHPLIWFREKLSRGFKAAYADPSLLWTAKGKDGKTVSNMLDDKGMDGWELVSATPVQDSSGQDSYTVCVLFTFKRPLP